MHIQAIDYVSAPPGTGKTRAATIHMARHILRGRNKKAVGAIVYVAPTIKLLEQTRHGLFTRLEKKLTQEEFDTIVPIVTSEHMNDDRAVSKIQNLLSGRGGVYEKISPLANGSVLFVTHASFLKLKVEEGSLLANSTVLFDEAKKWMEVRSDLELTDEVERLFKQLFTTQAIPDLAGIERVLPIQGAKRPTTSNKDQDKNYSALLALYASSVDNPRVELYRSIQVSRKKKARASRDMMVHTFPQHPFLGFERVVILSARFERSQMYHMLEEACSMNDVTEEFMEVLPNGGYEKAKKAYRRRQRKVVIMPLSLEGTLPSSTKYNHGIYVPFKYADKVYRKIKKAGLVDKQIAQIRKKLSYTSAVVDADLEEIYQYMKKKGCVGDIRKWEFNNTLDFINAKASKHEAAGSHWPISPIIGYAEDEKITKVPCDPERLQDRYARILSQGAVEGINRFRDATVTAYLASFNATPNQRRILKYKYEGYEPNNDYTIDKADQSVCRGCVRDANSDETMIAIVPTMRLALELQKVMDHLPKIDTSLCESLGDMVAVSYNNSKRDRKDKAQKDADYVKAKKEAIKRHRAGTLKKFGPKYNSLTVTLSRLRKKLKADPNNKALKKQESTIIKQREQLKKGVK